MDWSMDLPMDCTCLCWAYFCLIISLIYCGIVQQVQFKKWCLKICLFEGSKTQNEARVYIHRQMCVNSKAQKLFGSFYRGLSATCIWFRHVLEKLECILEIYRVTVDGVFEQQPQAYTVPSIYKNILLIGFIAETDYYGCLQWRALIRCFNPDTDSTCACIL